MPAIRPAPLDEPGKRADDQLLTGPLVAYLEALIDAAMAHSGALNTDEKPEDVLCEATGMSHLEYEAVVLRAGGADWKGVAQSQAVTLEEARAAGKEGVRKLRRFVRT